MGTLINHAGGAGGVTQHPTVRLAIRYAAYLTQFRRGEAPRTALTAPADASSQFRWRQPAEQTLHTQSDGE